MKNTTVWCLNRTVTEPQREPRRPTKNNEFLRTNNQPVGERLAAPENERLLIIRRAIRESPLRMLIFDSKSPTEVGLDATKIFLWNQRKFVFKLFNLLWIVLAMCVFCFKIIVKCFQYVNSLNIFYLGFFGFTFSKVYFS